MMTRLKKLKIYFLGMTLMLLWNGCTNGSEQSARSSDGVAINFEKKGKGKPSVIFVHGWSNNLSIWDEQMEHFSQNYTVIGIDLAGFGKSGNNRQEWIMSSFGDDVVAVMDKLDLKEVVLVGFSMGGPVIVEVAKKVPDRILGLVFVDTLHDIEMQFSPETVDYMDSIFMDLVTTPTPDKLEGVFYKNNKEASFARILNMIEGASHVGWKESLHENARWVNEDCIESLKSIQTPIIAINSDSEPTNEEAFKNVAPSFKVHILSDVGHVVFWDKPDEFNKLLEKSIQEFVNGR